jgi:hypothetical protein
MRVRAKAEVNAQVLDEFENQNLTPLRDYVVMGYSEGYYRVVSDAGEPILYPKYLFDVESIWEPSDWVREEYGDGGYNVGPPECMARGFYERWFDRDPMARATFERVRQRIEASVRMPI